MDVISLDGSWRLTGRPEHAGTAQGATSVNDLPAEVPGNVELDLLRAKLIPDPALANNVYDLMAFEGHHWTYTRRFEGPVLRAGQRAQLVFDGIDTLASVRLNGELVGRSRNMLVPHRFDVGETLREGSSNELVVDIESAVLAERKRIPSAHEYCINGHYEYLGIRKASHMFGWDIMPRLVSAGVWRSVRLELLDPTRWRSVYCATLRVDPALRTAELFVDWDFTTPEVVLDGWSIRFALRKEGQTAFTRSEPIWATHGHSILALSGVEPWWPRGLGAPSLYQLDLELVDRAGEVRAQTSQIVGIRTLKLCRGRARSDDAPDEFVFRVNGERAMIKGTNWVPLDALHARDTQHLERTFALAIDLNCNMLRCWGGGVYEDHAFFDLCDRHGILVWQDFAFSCARYPNDDEFCAEVEREAEIIVPRLRNHPSLALWCGGNENDAMLALSASHRHIDPNDDRVSREVLARAVRRHDPHRDYLPNSPYVSPEIFASGDLSRLAEDHLWGPRGDYKAPFYSESHARFVSETGYHGCPAKKSLERWLGASEAWPWKQGAIVNDSWLTRAARPTRNYTRYDYRIELLPRQIANLFGEVPEDFDAFVLASQICQAEALKFFIERTRLGKWERTGILWWNLRDGWPIVSDAVVDYDYQKKLAYDFIKASQQDVCIVCSEASRGRHTLVVCNDTRVRSTGRVSVTDVGSGQTLFEGTFDVAANENAAIGSVPVATRPSMYTIAWQTSANIAGRNHYTAGGRPLSLAEYSGWLERLGIAETAPHWSRAAESSTQERLDDGISPPA